MAAPSTTSESEKMSTTLTNSSLTESPRSLSQGTTQTSMTDTPLMGNRPPLTPQRSTQTSDDHVPGWPCIAKLMAVRPEFEAYSRFRELNVKNLLYYQVELTELREELKKLELDDWRKRELSDAGKFAKYADYLIASPTLESPKDRKQWKVVVKIRKLLKQYSKLDRSDRDRRALTVPPNLQMPPCYNTKRCPHYQTLTAATLRNCENGSRDQTMEITASEAKGATHGETFIKKRNLRTLLCGGFGYFSAVFSGRQRHLRIR